MKNNIKLIILLTLLLTGIIGCSDLDTFTQNKTADNQNINNAKIRLFEKRIFRDPQSFLDCNRLAHLYIQKARETGDTGYYGKADNVLNKSLHINPANYIALVYKGLVSISKHDFENALKFGKQARDMNPQMAYAYGVIGDASKELGDLEKAEQAYNSMSELNPGLDSYSRLSNLETARGKTTEAIEAMQKAYQFGIKQASPRENVAWTQVMTGALYFNAGNLDTAQMYYKKGLDIMDNYYLALEHIAEVYAAKGNYEKALKLYNEVLKTNPKPQFYLAKAVVLDSLGRYKESEDSKLKARQYMESHVSNGDVGYLRDLAMYYADNNIKLDKSLKLAQEDFGKRRDSHAYDTLAWVYYKKGIYNKALIYSDESLKSGIKDAQIYYHAGLINYKNGNRERAEKYLELAINMNPYYGYK